MIISTVKEDYPTVYKALMHIALDNGCINRIDPEESLPDIPSSYVDRLDAFEIDAKRIGPKLEAFCTADELEISGLVDKYDVLYFGDFLNDWFELL